MMFWFCWCADNTVIALGVITIFLVLGVAAYKAFF
ncbi:hypothetical protein BCAL_0718 [Bifidobacterium callitrichos DSM 23973]|uniref:Uncharacterized protein n=1 Tax=Bifidobacterium callitrichos DSM 23973 TaxID=1437609 RepID=A0A087A9L0_9BIFI|nr:hypothetical protein BCAL_0718 [Bifidobacterium callitrichos DSM 23973]